MSPHHLWERANGVEYDIVKESAVLEDAYLYRDIIIWSCGSRETGWPWSEGNRVTGNLTGGERPILESELRIFLRYWRYVLRGLKKVGM